MKGMKKERLVNFSFINERQCMGCGKLTCAFVNHFPTSRKFCLLSRLCMFLDRTAYIANNMDPDQTAQSGQDL